MALQVFKITFFLYRSKIYKVIIFVLYLVYWILGISPFTNNYKIYQAFLFLWYCEIALLTTLDIIYDIVGDTYSLNRLVRSVLYVTYLLGHLTALIESHSMFQRRLVLVEQISNIKNKMEHKLKKNLNIRISALRISRILTGVLVLLICCHGIIMWSTSYIDRQIRVLYWRCLQSYLVTQFKTLEFLTNLLLLNNYMILIRQVIEDMGERNLKRVFNALKKCQKSKILYVSAINEEENDTQLLTFLKDVYNEVYVTLQVFNKSYSWSIFTSTAVYFVEFVCNIYWIFLAVLHRKKDFFNILQNSSHAIMAFVLLYVSCFYADECYYQSRYIGCLISKLAKPAGNKQYNDLITEFSLQTLHQRFYITAKDFFTLNLSLLGGMIAAIVTYLVILLQFTFTE